jgi:hypothetical protein
MKHDKKSILLSQGAVVNGMRIDGPAYAMNGGQRVHVFINCVCEAAGHEVSAQIGALVRDDYVCPACASGPKPDEQKVNRIVPGTLFGEWLVVRDESSHRPYSQRRILCRCSCGAEEEVLATNLFSGRSQRCVSCAPMARNKARGGDEPSHVTAGRSFMRAVYEGCVSEGSPMWDKFGGAGVQFLFPNLNEALAWMDKFARPGEIAQFKRIIRDGPIGPDNLTIYYVPDPMAQEEAR